MQTLTIGRTKYKLSPSRNVGELQSKVSKITGKTKKTAIAKCRRSYPTFYAGQSTDEYVKSFYGMNFCPDSGMSVDAMVGQFFEPLNSEPCTLYSGADLHETLTDDTPETAAVTQEAAPVDAPANPLAGWPISFGSSVIHRFAAPTPAAPADTVRDVSDEMTGEEFDAIGEAFSALTPAERARTSWDAVRDAVLQRLRNAPTDPDPTPPATPLPRVLYSDFIRSAGKREAPMTA